MTTGKHSHPTPPQPKQQQSKQPGIESEMQPQPQKDNPQYTGSGKLKGKVAIITGGDSGIGRAVAIAFAKEGANVVIVYLNEHEDAKKTKQLIEEKGKQCELIAGDIGDEKFCEKIVQQALNKFNHIDIVVNNAAEQHEQKKLEDISADQLEKTFRTNIFSMFYLTKAALPHLREGSAIINSTSVTAYKGSPELLDYSATKGAIVAFTRSLSQALVQRKIRVNAVAPGPIWTPLIPASFDSEKVAKFGEQVPLKRAGQPEEIAPSYVFLASELDSSYMTGQVLHPNGGTIVNS
jgi:NAD(P)-dependent dehydrogenase (short-subunit alcohol dehydrogenase family)